MKCVLIKCSILADEIVREWRTKEIVRMLLLKIEIPLVLWLMPKCCSSYPKATEKFPFHFLNQRKWIHMHSTDSKRLLIIILVVILSSSNLIVGVILPIVILILIVLLIHVKETRSKLIITC